MNKGKITIYFRKLGLIKLTDQIKYSYYKLSLREKNRRFLKANPTVNFPPEYMMFESFKLDYERYYTGGRETSEWVMGKFKQYSDLEEKTILDWGCGPARLTRHLPLMVSSAKVHGTDYNAETIQWCRDHIDNVEFNHNEINRPLTYDNGSFDLIIGISIFTHMSEANHEFWVEELHRVVKPEGLIFLTTAGEIFTTQMTSEEARLFRQNQLVIRSNTTEGHRTFGAFQPRAYFERLVSDYFEIVDYKAGEQQSWGLEQDYWVLRAKK